MKKFSFLSALLMLLGLSATAEESISVSDVLVPKGGQAMMEVNFHFNTGHDYVSYQFTVNLPDGISLATDNYGTVPVTLGDGQPASIFKGLDLNATTHILTCYSNPSTPINGTDGVLVRIPIKADADKVDVGDVLTGSLTAVQFAHIDASGQDFGDASIKITIDEADDGRIHFDENSTTLPDYNTTDLYDVTIHRTIKAGEWSTLVLPFTLTKTKAQEIFGTDGTDVKYAKYNGFTADYGDDPDNVVPLAITINCEKCTIPSRGGLAAGTPILIKTTQDITEPIKIDNVKLTNKTTIVSIADEYNTSGKYIGSFVKTKVPADGLFLSANKFYYSTGKTNVKGLRCWFELGAVLDKETEDWGSRISLSFNDETNGISDATRLGDNGAYYSLDGRKLDNRPVRKGVYIRNGKKNVIK